VAKDRARPFSRKHRRYWLTVTGGMVVIAVVNVAIGLCSYKSAPPSERIELKLPERDAAVILPDAAGTMGASELPADVMRAFAVKYPRLIPAGARVDGQVYTIDFPPGAGHAHARFKPDGTFISED